MYPGTSDAYQIINYTGKHIKQDSVETAYSSNNKEMTYYNSKQMIQRTCTGIKYGTFYKNA